MISRNNCLILFFLVILTVISPIFSQQDCYINESNEDIDCALQNYPVDYSFRYFNVGGGPFFVIPNIGIGYRERHESVGKDIALSASSVGICHLLGIYAMGHYYLSPLEQNSYYIGCGAFVSFFILNEGTSEGYLSPNFVFGKEFKQSTEGHHFLELQITAPSMILKPRHNRLMYMPLIFLKYGMSF